MTKCDELEDAKEWLAKCRFELALAQQQVIDAEKALRKVEEIDLWKDGWPVL